MLARVGLVAKGVFFAIAGFLALEVAFGQGGKSTSREGALATLARHGSGKWLLVALAAGFAAYVMWPVAQAFFERDDEGSKRSAKRIGYLGRAAIYSALTYSALKFAIGSVSHESQNERARKTTAEILSWPGGTWW